MSLTPKQEAFCLAYLETGNASEAYRRAYAASNSSPKVVHNKASELLARGDIGVRVAALKELAASAAIMNRREAMERLTVLARTGITDLVDFATVELGSGEDGPVTQSTWTIKDSVLHDPVKLAAISELTAGREGIKIKTHSPLQAIQQLAKMEGWESASKHEHTGAGGGPIQAVTRIELVDLVDDSTDSTAA